jgi:glycine hydroxymethyltransferase
MREIAGLIARAVRADLATEAGTVALAEVAGEVGALVEKFPAYPR